MLSNSDLDVEAFFSSSTFCSLVLSLSCWAVLYVTTNRHRAVIPRWSTPETSAFRKHYGTLRGAVQSPDWLASELYSRSVICDDTKEDALLNTLTRYKKCQILLDAVGKKVASDAQQFHVFTSILKQEPSMSKLCQLLQNAYCTEVDRGIQTSGSANIDIDTIYCAGCDLLVAYAATILTVILLHAVFSYNFTICISISSIICIWILCTWLAKPNKMETSSRMCQVTTAASEHKSNNCMGLPNTITSVLPRHLSISVTNYRHLQRVIAVTEVFLKYSELKLREEEKFCPILKLLDTQSGHQLCYNLVLHGEKLPRFHTSFTCSIEVSIEAFPFSEHQSELSQSLVHFIQTENVTTRHDTLRLQFCFLQASTDYIIQFRIHSIVDLDGIECTGYNSEPYTCIVRAVRKELYGAESGTMVTMTKGLPLTYFTHPCVGKSYDRMSRLYLQLALAGDSKAVRRLTMKVTTSGSIAIDLKVAAMCYQALEMMMIEKQTTQAQSMLNHALQLATSAECKNTLLLQGRVLRYYASTLRYCGHYKEAMEYIDRAKIVYWDVSAAPSCDTACLRFEEAKVLELLQKGCHELPPEDRKYIEKALSAAIDQSYHSLDYEQNAIGIMHTHKAMFHLQSFNRFSDMDDIPIKYTPTREDLNLAELSLKAVPTDQMGDVNVYKIDYYIALSDLHRWRNQHREAAAFAEAAEEQCKQGNVVGEDLVMDRLALLAKQENTEQQALEDVLDSFWM